MEMFNVFNATELDPPKTSTQFAVKSMVLLMAPMTPHFSEELWEMLGNKDSIFKAKWPSYDDALTVEDSVEFVIQVNGKIRDKVKLELNAAQEKAEAAAFASDKVLEWTKGKETVKKIFVPNKLLNIVVK